MPDLLARFAAVALGGAAGSVARYALGLLAQWALPTRFALATLAANVLGCFAIGLLMHDAWSGTGRAPAPWHTGVTVGVLGGLTTFSAFGHQTVRHLEQGEPLAALANVALNLTLGLGAVAAGGATARALWPAA